MFSNKKIVDFFFELGQLRIIDHEGWRLIGVEFPESVADHSLRAAQIGFILAKLENYENPFEVCSLVIFHDIEECRIGDIHKVANRYVSADKERAVKEQLKSLGKIGEEIFKIWKRVNFAEDRAGIIAKDADLIEQAVTAKEYMEKGYSYAEDWINNVEKKVKTNSAKKLLKLLRKSDPNDWWQGLKKIY